MSDLCYKITMNSLEVKVFKVGQKIEGNSLKFEINYSELDENSIKSDKNSQNSNKYPQEMTTRLGIDKNHVIEDEIQNLEVTLVPIIKSAPLQETNLLRPQSPVCDFIQKVLQESYV